MYSPKCKFVLPCALVIVLVLGFAVNFALQKSTSTLQLVTVVFRHGERTLLTTYPNDPYINQTYYPYGVAQITTAGKRRLYNIGSQLRSMYGEFLGEIYSYDIVRALSSDFPRTRMSMQALLAGLFPPIDKYEIEPGLKWQPVDFKYIKFDEDDMLAFWGKCKEYDGNEEKLFKSPIVEEIDRKYKDVYDYISLHSGKNCSSIFDVCWFYPILNTQVTYGLKLPKWAEKVYPQPVEYFHREIWKALVADTKGRRYTAGRLLETIGGNLMQKIDDSSNKKIYLYGGHDYSIAGLLASMNIDHDYELPYGAFIILELHKINEEYSIKVLYQDYTAAMPKIMTMNGCEELCPINKFINITSVYYPNPDVCTII